MQHRFASFNSFRLVGRRDGFWSFCCHLGFWGKEGVSGLNLSLPEGPRENYPGHGKSPYSLPKTSDSEWWNVCAPIGNSSPIGDSSIKGHKSWRSGSRLLWHINLPGVEDIRAAAGTSTLPKFKKKPVRLQGQKVLNRWILFHVRHNQRNIDWTQLSFFFTPCFWKKCAWRGGSFLNIANIEHGMWAHNLILLTKEPWCLQLGWQT